MSFKLHFPLFVYVAYFIYIYIYICLGPLSIKMGNCSENLGILNVCLLYLWWLSVHINYIKLTHPMDINEISRIKKVDRRWVRNESHIECLETCLQNQITSKGFRLGWIPASQPTEQEANDIENILDNSSKELTKTVLQHNKNIRICLLQT